MSIPWLDLWCHRLHLAKLGTNFEWNSKIYKHQVWFKMSARPSLAHTFWGTELPDIEPHFCWFSCGFDQETFSVILSCWMNWLPSWELGKHFQIQFIDSPWFIRSGQRLIQLRSKSDVRRLCACPLSALQPRDAQQLQFAGLRGTFAIWSDQTRWNCYRKNGQFWQATAENSRCVNTWNEFLFGLMLKAGRDGLVKELFSEEKTGCLHLKKQQNDWDHYFFGPMNGPVLFFFSPHHFVASWNWQQWLTRPFQVGLPNGSWRATKSWRKTWREGPSIWPPSVRWSLTNTAVRCTCRWSRKNWYQMLQMLWTTQNLMKMVLAPHKKLGHSGDLSFVK